MQKIYISKEIAEIGTVHFWKSNNARYLNIRVKPFEGIQVSIPNGMSQKKAEELVKSKSRWITKNLRKVREYEKQTTIYDGQKQLVTRNFKISVVAANVKTVSAHLLRDKIKILYPQNTALSGPEVQNAIRSVLTKCYRIEAKSYLPKRVRQLAEQFGFRCKKVFIKNQKSRWGSCSVVNNINLNLNLMRLPDDLIDYVILHELVHTEIKNHSPAFWNRLSEVCNDVNAKRRKMRAYKLF